MKAVAPFTGAWIEMMGQTDAANYIKVAPFTGAWIEIPLTYTWWDEVAGVAPFTGAWIEIGNGL